jgi:hypothetical protein
MTTAKNEAVSGTASVHVGCKLPHGLVLELGKKGDDNYKVVTLKGANDSRIIGGYGITEVSKDFWEGWMKKTGCRLVPVKKGLIFVEGDLDRAQAHALDHASLKTGLEQIDTAKLPKGLAKLVND